jgi:hypothetical protein
VTKVRFEGAQHYLPFPHIHHAASTLRRLARSAEVGRYHLESAALVMTAFSVEAFCQTLGPEVLGSVWTAPPAGSKRPIERWSVTDKLKAIGKAVGVHVELGQDPWSLVVALMRARDELAHAKHIASERTSINLTLDVPDGTDPYDVVAAHVRDQMFPLHRIDRLDVLASEIDAGLLRLWEAAGHSAHTFDQSGMTSWTAKAV